MSHEPPRKNPTFPLSVLFGGPLPELPCSAQVQNFLENPECCSDPRSPGTHIVGPGFIDSISLYI